MRLLLNEDGFDLWDLEHDVLGFEDHADGEGVIALALEIENQVDQFEALAKDAFDGLGRNNDVLGFEDRADFLETVVIGVEREDAVKGLWGYLVS